MSTKRTERFRALEPTPNRTRVARGLVCATRIARTFIIAHICMFGFGSRACRTQRATLQQIEVLAPKSSRLDGGLISFLSTVVPSGVPFAAKLVVSCVRGDASFYPRARDITPGRAEPAAARRNRTLPQDLVSDSLHAHYYGFRP